MFAFEYSPIFLNGQDIVAKDEQEKIKAAKGVTEIIMLLPTFHPFLLQALCKEMEASKNMQTVKKQRQHIETQIPKLGATQEHSHKCRDGRLKTQSVEC